MAATIRIRKNRKKKFMVTVYHGGKRQTQSFATKREAEAACTKYNRLLASGKYGVKVDEPKQNDTLNHYIARWFKLVVESEQHSYAHGTKVRYRGVYDGKIKNDLGKVDVEKLDKPYLFQHFEDLQEKGHTRSDIALRIIIISGGLKMAARIGKVPSVATSGVLSDLYPSKTTKTPIVPFTDVEEQAILEVSMDYDVHPVILMLFTSGMRLGECLGLNWDCVNFQSGYVTIKRSYRANHLSERTKTKKERKVPVNDSVLGLLNTMKMERNKERLKGNDVEAVFVRRNERLSQNSLRNSWKRILERAGIDYRKTHTIRHTVASKLLNSGYPIKLVAEILGHTVQTLLTTYAHVMEEDEDKKFDMIKSLQNATKADQQKEKAVNS